MPNPNASSTESLDAAVAESADALSTMENDAAEFFANRDASGASKALNPVAPALEKAASTPAKAAPPKSAPASSKSTSTTPLSNASTSKVPGAPSLKAVEKPAAAESTKTETTDATADFSDVPRDYTPGKTRAPQWEKLHAKADHYEAIATQRASELEAIRAELEAARTASVNGTPSADTQARLTALQQERDTLMARLEAVAVEKSPRFEAQFKPRRDAALAQAKTAVGPVEAERIEALLALPESSYRDEQVEALMATLPTLRASKLSQAVADIDRLTAERSSLAAQSSELYKQWASEETATRERQATERNSRANSTFEAELKEWEVAGVTPQEIETARSVYTGKNATLQDASRAALWGAVGPRVAQQLNESRSRIAELEGELAKLRSAQPGVGASGGGSGSSDNGDGEDDPALTGYSERIAKAALRQGVRFGA